jgi:peptide/nickel transport system permease protein
MKYGFDKPIATSIYIISMTSPISSHSKKTNQIYTYLSEGKYNAAQLFSFTKFKSCNQDSILRESFQKSGKKV